MVIPGSALGNYSWRYGGEGTIWDARDEIWMDCVQGEHPTHGPITPTSMSFFLKMC